MPTEEKLQYEVRRVDPKYPTPRKKNARFMTAEQMMRLVENIKRDGGLTSSVLLYQPDPDERPEILSGHHRIQAAIMAEFDEIDAHIITTPIDEGRKTSIQISHNSIVGQDDVSVLTEMYEKLELDEKVYSGLTDDDIKDFDIIDVTSLTVGIPNYRELSIFFLQNELEEFKEVMDRIEKYGLRSEGPEFHFALYADFDKLFDAVVDIKAKYNIGNSAIAFGIMAELALERLNQIEGERNGSGTVSDTEE